VNLRKLLIALLQYIIAFRAGPAGPLFRAWRSSRDSQASFRGCSADDR
jgi:hypothetical protein